MAGIAAIFSNYDVAMPYELRRRRNNASALDLSAGDSNGEEEEEDADEPMTCR